VRTIAVLLRAAVVVLVAVGAIVAAIGVAVAAARLADEPAVFLGAGWVVLAGGVALAAAIAAWGIEARAGSKAVAIAVSVLVASAVAGRLVLLPLPDRASPPAPVPGMRIADLSTGSRLAYVRVPAHDGASGAAPIVVLHGGPGVADMRGDLAFFGRLAADGRDVILYDQVGAGHSSRLADPSGYSLDRDLADLEALLAALGVERAVLVGHSYGASLATAYLARHRSNVERIVLLAPGAIRPHAREYGTGMVDRLSDTQRIALYAQLVQPRALLGWLLSQANPVAAHAFAGDRELDARYDRVYQLNVPGLFCNPGIEPATPTGLGFYTNAIRRDVPDLRPALAGVTVPALILKPQCDYLPWIFGVDLAKALPVADLVYIPGAGHSLYAERPDVVLAELRAFLSDRPLPIAPRADLAPPGDLRGPVG
jgi:proline iminopeptidase